MAARYLLRWEGRANGVEADSPGGLVLRAVGQVKTLFAADPPEPRVYAIEGGRVRPLTEDERGAFDAVLAELTPLPEESPGRVDAVEYVLLWLDQLTGEPDWSDTGGFFAATPSDLGAHLAECVRFHAGAPFCARALVGAGTPEAHMRFLTPEEEASVLDALAVRGCGIEVD